MARNAPQLDEPEVGARAPSAPRRVSRRARQQRWDTLAVGVMTPILLITTVVGVFTLGALFYPDPNPPEYFPPTATPRATTQARATATPFVVVQQVDTAKLNAGIIEKPPLFDWPEVEDLKLVPNPGRPNEQADYTPNIADVEKRKLVSASTVSVIIHSVFPLAVTATEELSKSYPLRARKQSVIDLDAFTGYLIDDSAFAVMFAHANYRIHVETVSGSPPFTEEQRAEVEYHTLHLADHILRRVQESASSGRRTGPESTAVHWRDHLVRQISSRR